MVSRLWSSKMLSRCKRSSSLRHCCMVVFAFCQRHRYDLLMACAPHLSFLVVVFLLLFCVWLDLGVGLVVVGVLGLWVVGVVWFFEAWIVVSKGIKFVLGVVPL